jgi:hypothetical protein
MNQTEDQMISAEGIETLKQLDEASIETDEDYLKLAEIFDEDE